MYNNDYMYAIERSDEYLAHYGIRGMKWGVRKAIQSGNSAKLSRQYAKASKKLAKLEKRAAKSDKYARRAALMGAGAAAAGGLAVAGTSGVSKFMKNNAKYAGKAVRGAGSAMVGVGKLASKIPGGNKFAGKMIGAGYGLQSKGIKSANAVYNAGTALNTWGNSNSIGQGVKVASRKLANATKPGLAGDAYRGVNKALFKSGHGSIVQQTDKLGKVSNNTIARIGAGAIGAGLAVGAAKNAYRAATAKKKAEKFRAAMNESFKGTKYANGGNQQSSKPRQGKKRRR